MEKDNLPTWRVETALIHVAKKGKRPMNLLEIYEDTTPIAIALELADRGWKVFPCRVWWSEEQDKYLKEPLKARGFSWKIHGSSDPDTIKEWPWAGMNAVGVCGFATVLDQDDGAKEPLPLGTLCQRTISGGYHHFFMPDPSITNAEKVWQDLPDQCNVRGVSNGWVVWYDSLIDPDAAMAYWPYNRKPEPERERRPQGPGNDSPITRHPEYVHLMQKDYPSRSERDCAVAGLMFSEGYTLSQFRSAITQIGPDLSSACDPANDFERQTTRLWDYVSWEEVAKGITVDPDELGYFGSFSNFPEVKAPPSYCGDWLRGQSYSMIYSRAGIGKTALLSSLVEAIRTEEKWLGMETSDPGPILWVNGDMPDWQVTERLGHLNGYADLWHCPMVNLLNHQELLLDRCKDYGLVILDNRSCLFQLQDANAAEAWQPLNELMRRIADAGAANLLATHEGKGEGTSSFGSSAQEWHTDTIMRVSMFDWDSKTAKYQAKHPERMTATRKLTFPKARLSAEPKDRHFRIESRDYDSAVICTLYDSD